MSEPKPFKAHFEYSHQGRFKDAFSEIIWSRLFSDNPELHTKAVIHNHSVLFDIPYLKKDSKINLDFEQIHSVSPKKITKSNYNNSIEFKFNSKPIDVLKVFENEITFSNDKSEVHNVALSNKLKLIRH